MKYKKFLFVLPLLLSFGIIFFSPDKVQAGDPCSRATYDKYKASLFNPNWGYTSPGAGFVDILWGESYTSLPISFHCFTTNRRSVSPLTLITSKGNFVASNGVAEAWGYHSDNIFLAGIFNSIFLPCGSIVGCSQVTAFLSDNPSHDTVSEHFKASNPLFTPSSTSTIAEDAVIDSIASTGYMSVKTDGAPINIPATNCVRIGGADPDAYAASHGGKQPIKVVFMRGESWDSSVEDFLVEVTDAINNGFKGIDPFASYFGDFSFYIDLKKIEDDDLLPRDSILLSYFSTSVGDIVKVNSSCFGITNAGTQYIMYHDVNDMDSAYAIPVKNIVFIPEPFSAGVTIHEFAHSLAKLMDEYLKAESSQKVGSFWNYKMREYSPSIAKNCTTDPRISYKGSDNLMYGSVTSIGCSFIYETGLSPKIDSRLYYRPSDYGLMNEDYSGKTAKFSVIDCGYIIAGIKGEPVSKANAQKYWPECLEMAKKGTILNNGLPPAGPATNISPPPPPPTSSRFQLLANVFSEDMWRSLMAQVGGVKAVGVYKASPSFQVKVYGTNFTPTDNAVQLTHIATGAIYEVLDIPNTAGQPITFAVASSTPPGEYTIKAGGFNSPWSNSLSFSVLAPKVPVISVFSANPININSGQSTTITWSSDGAETCTGTSNTSVPTGWSNPGLSGSLTFVPSGATTLSLTCVGPGGTKVSVLQISGNTTSKPVVTLTANPQSVTTGNSTTLSWTAYNATSCVGGSSSGFFSSAWNKTQSTSGSLYITPAQNSALTLACTGPAGVSTTTTYITLTNTNNLAVSCSVDPVATVWNGLVTFTATATGGNGPYTYSWTGDDGLVGNMPSVSNYYFSSPTPRYVYYKTATVTVTSGGQSVIKQCPSIPINPSTASGGYMPTLYSISSSQGPVGTTLTLSGLLFGMNQTGIVDNMVAVVIENGGNTVYIKPRNVVKTDTRGSTSLDFDFYPSIPLLSTPGTIYNISVQNGVGVRSNSVPFTLTSSVPIPVTTPALTQITPTSATFGLVSTPITLSGTGFTSASVVTAKQGNNIRTFTPTTVSATSLVFAFFPDSFISGALTLYVNNQGKTSNEIGFALAGQNPSCTISTPTVTGSGPYNVKVPVSITNGPPMTTYYLYRSSSSAPNYVKTGYITTGSSGSTNISISDSSALSAGVYSYTILGNKVDAPKCSPAQTVTVGAGVVTPPVVTPPIVPQPPISPCLSPNVWNGTACVSPVTQPSLTLNTSNISSTYKLGDILPIKWTSKGVEKVNINLLDYKGSTIIRTIATVSASLGQYDWKVSDIDFSNSSTYVISVSDASNSNLTSKSGKIDFTPAPIPVTVLPWIVSTNTAFVGQSFTYTLNWSGGPLDKSWRVFAHMIKDDNSHIFTGGDFLPNPTTLNWTGNIVTTNTITIPAGTPPGTYKVMVGLYDGAPRVQNLIDGGGVTSDTQYRHQVGTITILAPVQTQGASIWDAISGFFGKLFGE